MNYLRLSRIVSIASVFSTVFASSFVTQSGADFMLNGSKFVAVGPNCFWLGLLQIWPDSVYPTHNQIEEMFIVANYMNSTVIRSHTLGITSGDSLTLRPRSLNPIVASNTTTGANVYNNAAWESIDYAFLMAEKYNIKLIVPLIDSYNYYNGNYGDFTTSRNVTKPEFYTSTAVRADLKLAISMYLNHVNQYSNIAIKNSPALFMLELGNELGNLRPDSTSTAIPTQEWIIDITSYIKSIDSVHFVLDGADESLGQSSDFQINSLDAYSSHFYYFDNNRLNTGVNSAASVSKPYVIGEFSSGIATSFFATVESQTGIKGNMFWSLLPHYNGINGGGIVAHNDGYSVYYPESMMKLLPIANHFQRMRGLPVTSNIGPIIANISSSTMTATSVSTFAAMLTLNVTSTTTAVVASKTIISTGPANSITNSATNIGSTTISYSTKTASSSYTIVSIPTTAASLGTSSLTSTTTITAPITTSVIKSTAIMTSFVMATNAIVITTTNSASIASSSLALNSSVAITSTSTGNFLNTFANTFTSVSYHLSRTAYIMTTRPALYSTNAVTSTPAMNSTTNTLTTTPSTMIKTNVIKSTPTIRSTSHVTNTVLTSSMAMFPIAPTRSSTRLPTYTTTKLITTTMKYSTHITTAPQMNFIQQKRVTNKLHPRKMMLKLRIEQI